MQTDVRTITNWHERLSLRTSCLSGSIIALLIVTFGGAPAARAQACPSTSASYPCAYVSTSTGITVIDLATQTALSTQIALPNAVDLAASPDNSYLWAVTSSSASNSTVISAIDTATGVIGTPITILLTGQYASAFFSLASTPDGRYVYLPSTLSPYLQVIDTTATTMTAKPIASSAINGLTPFQGVAGISIANGIVYVADSCYTGDNYTPCIDEVPIGTNTVTSIIQILELPANPATLYGISIVPGSTTAYVVISISGGSNPGTFLDGIDLSSGDIVSSAQLNTSSGSISPVLETPDGSQVYVANNGGVWVVSTSTPTVATQITVGFNGSPLAITPDGSSVYVTVASDSLNGIQIFSTTSNSVISSISTSASPPNSVAIMNNLPVPVIGQPLMPNAAPAGTAGLTLTVNGSQFVPSSTVNWNGSPLATTYVSPIQLTAVVPASDLLGETTATVTVVNPGPGGGTSNPSFFSITIPTPSVNFATSTVQIAAQGSFNPSYILSADFRNNGIQDLAVVSQCNSSNVTCTSGSYGVVTILLGHGDGTFDTGDLLEVSQAPVMAVAGDFNGDGKIDLAVLSNLGSGNLSVSILLGNGDGTFTPGTQTPYIGLIGNGPGLLGPLAAFVAGDFNRDGKLDLLVVNPSDGSYTLLLGNGNGTFTSVPSAPSVFLDPNSVAAGDFNGDGNLDFAVAGLNTESGVPQITIMLGNGDGTFEPSATPLSLDSDVVPTSLVSGSFNLDGIPDIAFSNPPGSIQVFTGNGDGSFTHASSTVLPTLSALALAAADLNGDNDLDLMATVWGSAVALLNLGNDSFQDGPSTNVGNDPMSVAIADFNGDGRLDAAVANSVDGTVTILLQAGIPTLNETSIAFGENYVGTSAGSPTDVTLTNTGSANLTFGPISITGTNSGEFTQINTCTTGQPSLSLAPGASCSVTAVSFTPTATGAASATLSFGPSLASTSVALTGTGVDVVINTQPQSQSIAPAQTATISVAATGIAATLSYQWYQGSAGDTTNPIAGATSATYTTPALSATTSYWVLVGAGAIVNPSYPASEKAASTTATITVVPPPAISVQPLSQSIAPNQTATLSVTATGTGTLTYQWYQGLSGNAANPIAGATGSTFTTPALTAATNYWVQVSASGPPVETVNSNTAAITVVSPPAISVQPMSQSVASGQTATLSVTATGTGTLTYQWYQGLSGDSTNPIAGATASTFTTPALTATTNYWVQVSASGPPVETVNSTTAAITVVPPPAISVQPLSQSIAPNQTATLSVTATGSGTVTYQWYQGLSGDTTNPIAGATASTFTTPALTAAANYWVQVSASGPPAETVNSNTAAIAIISSLAISVQPASQSIASGQTATLSVTAAGIGTLTYQWYQGLSGDSTNPIAGATSSTFTTPVLTADTSYWVQVSQSGPPTLAIQSISAIVVVGAVFAGQSETITLELSPNPAWPPNSTVTLNCTEVSLNGGSFVPISNYNLSCNVSPDTLSSSANLQPITVTIGSSAGTTAVMNSHGGDHLPYGAGLLPISGLTLLGVGFLIPSSRRKRGLRRFVWTIVALGCVGFTSCGGHFTPPVSSGGKTVTPAGKYEVLVVVTDTQAPTGFQQTSLVVPLTVSPMPN